MSRCASGSCVRCLGPHRPFLSTRLAADAPLPLGQHVGEFLKTTIGRVKHSSGGRAAICFASPTDGRFLGVVRGETPRAALRSRM